MAKLIFENMEFDLLRRDGGVFVIPFTDIILIENAKGELTDHNGIRLIRDQDHYKIVTGHMRFRLLIAALTAK